MNMSPINKTQSKPAAAAARPAAAAAKPATPSARSTPAAAARPAAMSPPAKPAAALAAKPATTPVPPVAKPATAVVPANQGGAVAVIDEDIAAMIGGGQGSENVTAAERAIPFVVLLQDLSPQTKKTRPEYIEGASPGQFFNTATQEVLGETVTLVPCYFSRVITEWKPRKEGGGFVGIHAYDPAILAAGIREGSIVHTDRGTDLVDTHQHFCLLLRDGRPPEPVLVPMKSTSIAVSRRWNNAIDAPKLLANGQTVPNPARYLCSYEFGTTEQSNDQGAWYQWVLGAQQILANDPANWPLIKQANAFANSCSRENVKVDYAEMPSAAPSDAPEGAPADIDNEIEA
jgi:hypothetical protein